MTLPKTAPATTGVTEKHCTTSTLFCVDSRHRGELAADPYRPHYHFVSPEGNLNDPNGLCFWQGKWHLSLSGLSTIESPAPLGPSASVTI